MYRCIVYLTLVAGLVQLIDAQSYPECGITGGIDVRIAGGTVADNGSWPWIHLWPRKATSFTVAGPSSTISTS